MTIEYWRDFDIEFERANNGDVVTMTNFDAVHNSLTNIFLTFQGSRRMLPLFALGIYKLLFEPIDFHTAGLIADLMYEAVERWEPRIEIEGLDILANADSNQYEITLNYRILEDKSGENSREFSTVLRAK